MLYVAATTYIIQNEEKFFFEHQELEQNEAYNFGSPYLDLSIEVNKDLHLNAIWYTQESPQGVVLYFPDGDYLSMEYEITQNYFYSNGYSLLIPDYRGTGKSTSSYQNEEDIFEDALQWYKMAHSLADTTPLIICGREFGSGIAAQVGAHHEASLVLLENPYYSWNEIMLKEYFWWIPHTWFTQYQIPLWKYVRQSTNKIILVHASHNEDYPLENSHRLLEFLKPGDDLIELNSTRIDHQSSDYQKSMEKLGFTYQKN